MAGRIVFTVVLAGYAFFAAGVVQAQGRGPANWTTVGYDAQRSFWIRTDPKISTDSLRKPGFQFLWKVKLEGRLTPMIVLDPYTGYRGHKSLGYLGGSSDDIFGIDIDLGIVEWHDRLASGSKDSGTAVACPGGLTSAPARPASVAIQGLPANRGGGARGGPARGSVGEPRQGAVNLQAAAPAAARGPAAPAAVAVPAALAVPAVVRPNAVYAVAGDGMLRTMYVSNGADVEPPVRFLPPHANAVGLIVVDNVAYAETIHGCGGVPDGVWALDLNSKQVANWSAAGTATQGATRGAAGPAFGPDGTLYGTAGNTIAALEPKSLKLRNSFAGKEEFASSPVVFPFQDKILVAAGTREGSIYLLDGGTMNVVDKTQGGSVAKGDLSSWQDGSGTRWILAADSSSVSAWKVVDQNGAAALRPGWAWTDVESPLTPIVVNGVMFALSGRERPVLFAVDAATGEQLWNSGKAIPSPVHGGGLSAGGSQIYVETDDGNLYAFGFPMEH